ncbi:MAG: transcription termination factor NusA [Arcanobacterium sp.]|nr:transcription termination factor NusA [Arcanobacterium sp.]MDY5274084.1 transcription termination factor NusA [Arcanobacterium sp.]
MDISMSELRIVESELGINISVLIEAIEDALLHAYQRVPGAIKGARVELDRTSGKATVWAPEVDEEGVKIGEFDDTPGDFGRIATSTARSIIAQRLREAESKRVLGSFRGKQGQIVSGVVESAENQRPDSRDLFVELGENKGVLRSEEQVPTEHFKHGDLIRALVLDVSVGPRGASIRLSRSHPDFVRQLFETEVPEIANGIVEIVALAREAGHRTKIAVWSSDPNVAAKGASIGHNAQRVRAVTQELQGEKIDVVEYSDDPAQFIRAALSPAKVLAVHILNKDARQALAVVPDDQASLAIGKEAQNVRLAAKLTGWNIDIRKESEVAGRTFAD